MFPSARTGYGGYNNTYAQEYSIEGQMKTTIEFNVKARSAQCINKSKFSPVKELMLWCKKEVEEKTGIKLVFVRAHALKQRADAHAVFRAHRVCFVSHPLYLRRHLLHPLPTLV